MPADPLLHGADNLTSPREAMHSMCGQALPSSHDSRLACSAGLWQQRGQLLQQPEVQVCGALHQGTQQPTGDLAHLRTSMFRGLGLGFKVWV